MNRYWLFSVQYYLNLLIFKKTWNQLKLKSFFAIANIKLMNFVSFQKTLNMASIFFKNKRILTQKLLNLKKNNLFFFIYNELIFQNLYERIAIIGNLHKISWKHTIFKSYKKSFGEGFIYLRGLLIIFFTDACITDDEPLWEPLEWSLIQTWIFFIFIFAWIAENLITSRFGSYTGRDKRVWFAWYKTFWLIEGWYLLTYLTASCFVIVPFYYEITYNMSFIFSWWHWYTKIFFYKFISVYSLIVLVSYLLLINLRWLNWKKLLFLILIINIFIAYLLYTHFIMSFFAYFTDPLWYQKNRLVDYIQLSHEPLKWGWGPSKRDHFSYHKTSTVFWFKNDNPFAGSFIMIHLFFFLSLFFLYLYWLVLLRKIYVTQEVSFTFTAYCVSALRQFFFLFLMLYFLIFLSFIVSYWRFPVEFIWLTNSQSWFSNLIIIFTDFLLLIVKWAAIY